MKIDWKKVSQSKGYKSLKGAYIKDAKTATTRGSLRSKQEYYKRFQLVIGKAKNYSYHTGKPIEEILLEWENRRDYWWFSFYNHYKPPKLTGSVS